MTDRLPDDDPDGRLARRLDAGEPPDGTDPLHAALDAARPDDAAVDPARSARLWTRVDGEIGDRTDRPALRLVRSRPTWSVWAAAAMVLVAVGLWWTAQGPEVVAVAGAEVVTWTAPDGSSIVLRPHTELARLGARAYRVEGEAFFAVAHDPSRPFTVAAGGASVRVLGTRFDVSTWGGRTDVFVEEGRVRVSGAGEAVDLAAGTGATATRAGVAVRPDVRADAALDWRRGEAVFERETARRVADELGQHFGIAVALPTAVAGQTISGALDLGSPPDALDALGRILGGRFVPDGDGVRFVAR
ncbi:FecR family protein [Rubrivirga sp. IMCC43871]|uniref:FecR family protein n=1 Tax=Rubrivirga sp. IMCC43871 TaxID=3391575 RepID=UPI00398FB763